MRSEGEKGGSVHKAFQETVRVEPDGIREAEGDLAERRRARVSCLDRGQSRALKRYIRGRKERETKQKVVLSSVKKA